MLTASSTTSQKKATRLPSAASLRTGPRRPSTASCFQISSSLPQYPGRSVALVESEKTAIICAALMPEHIWLATGGKSQLSEEKMRPLRGRTIIAFPDIDAYDTWRTKLGELKGYDITISDYLEKTATPEQREAHIDIADLLIADCPTTPLPTPARQPRIPPHHPLPLTRQLWPCSAADGRFGPRPRHHHTAAIRPCPTVGHPALSHVSQLSPPVPPSGRGTGTKIHRIKHTPELLVKIYEIKNVSLWYK